MTASKSIARNPNLNRKEQGAILADLRKLQKSSALDRLDRMLNQFNVFRVLRFEDAEIRHSNMLAWLLDKDETHGLGDTFLRAWLLRVVQDSDSKILSPKEINTAKFHDVEVWREWKSLDLLVKMTTDTGDIWVIAIENKLRAKQGDGQLSRYRKSVEKDFPTARLIFIFLIEKDEKPDDNAFLTAKHEQVRQVLSDCLKKRKAHFGKGPNLLIRDYLQILEDKSMENSKIRLAQNIYARHRRAIDVIFDHRTKPMKSLSNAIAKCVKRSGKRYGMIATDTGWTWFLPPQWDTKENRAGRVWDDTNSAYVLVTISNYFEPNVWLEVIVTQCTGANRNYKKWRSKIYDLAKQNHLPMEDQWKKGKQDDWMRIYAVKYPSRIDHDEIRDYEKTAKEIWSWSKDRMDEKDFKKVIRLVAAHLKTLRH